MDEIILTKLSAVHAGQIAGYRSEFPHERMRVTYDPERIPVPSDTEASETFMNSAEILFTRQISHHFRASDILHEL